MYTIFDTHGCILYVGKTINFEKRIKSHAKHSLWFSQMAGYALIDCDNERQAHRIELGMIKMLNPAYNIAGRAKSGLKSAQS